MIVLTSKHSTAGRGEKPRQKGEKMKKDFSVHKDLEARKRAYRVAKWATDNEIGVREIAAEISKNAGDYNLKSFHVMVWDIIDNIIMEQAGENWRG